MCHAEASCSSQITTAQAVTSEMGDAAAHRSGIKRWADVQNKNSERDVNRIVKKQRTSLDVKISMLRIQEKDVAWINPKAWLQFIINHGLLYMLSGLIYETRNLVGTVWTEFWRRYEILNPDFSLFSDDNFDPAYTIGLFLHGDEGRTLKRGGLMVTSIQSVLGHGFREKRLKRRRDESRLHVNFAGHTFLTRFVLSVYPKTMYQSDPDFFHEAMDLMTVELKDLLDTGIRDRQTNAVYKFCIIGVKGDMPYLQKIGKLKRSWNTTVKRGSARVAPRGVCHLCLAGTNQYPCEDTSDSPCWKPTIGVQAPWDVTPGLLKVLPHNKSHPGSYFKPDLWHCVHLGIGKSFIASVLQLCLEHVPMTNNDDRFDWLTNHYSRWCRANRTACFVSKISAYLVSYNDATGASGNWSKGSLTSNLMRWLVPLLVDIGGGDRTLARCKEAAANMNLTLSFLYNAPLFLEHNECEYVYTKGMSFLQTYTSLAAEMFNAGRWHLFPLFPKIHAVHHVWLTIREDQLASRFALNPLTASCQQDEDVIGRVSRVSRRVNIRQVTLRTLQRHLMSCYSIWTGAKVLR